MRIVKKIKNWSLKKKIFWSAIFLILIALLFNINLIWYGLNQGYAQARILWNAKPIEEYLSDPHYPDSLKARINLIQEIREYAFDSLGLTRNENYTTLFDQKGKPILWIVTASEKYSLKEHEWSFPFLGKFSYKGFFRYDMAVNEAKNMEALGLETDINEVQGWSTLGYFEDPILSNFLERTPGQLADLIIHELTHGTLYVKDSVEYNENLASFIGYKGALRFLKDKYGEDSYEYQDFVKREELWKGFSELVLRKAEKLDSLYKAIEPLPDKEKEVEKRKALKKISGEFKNYWAYLKNKDPEFYSELDSVNNNFFLGFRRYQQNLDDFEKEFTETFGGDFHLYMDHLKEKYSSL